MHIRPVCLWGDNVAAPNLDTDSFCDRRGDSHFRKIKIHLEIRVYSVNLGGEMFNSNNR